MKPYQIPEKTIIITPRKDGTRRVQYHCGDVSMTDPASQKESDINNIMAHYTKTGMLPQISIPGEYRDNSDTPSLEDAFRIAKSAQDAFYRLPPNVRKLMDNDPSQLENFIADPNNRDYLFKEGVLIERKQETPDNKVIQVPDTKEKDK